MNVFHLPTPNRRKVASIAPRILTAYDYMRPMRFGELYFRFKSAPTEDMVIAYEVTFGI